MLRVDTVVFVIFVVGVAFVGLGVVVVVVGVVVDVVFLSRCLVRVCCGIGCESFSRNPVEFHSMVLENSTAFWLWEPEEAVEPLLPLRPLALVLSLDTFVAKRVSPTNKAK